MTNGANALYVNVIFVAYVLYMRVNSHVICNMESKVVCSNKEYVLYDVEGKGRVVGAEQ